MSVLRILKKIQPLLFLGILISSQTVAQMTVRQDRLPEDMVKEVLLGKGVLAKNVRFSGVPAALGEFSFADAHSFFGSGIVLSTGKASDMAGANENPKTSTVNGGPSDKNLYTLAGGRTFDAAALDFDFMTDKDSVSFNFIFASEEYNDYVGSTFNDAFALVISSTNMPAKNFAVLPGGNTPITVNSINAGQNRQFYVDNNPFTLVGKINEQVKANLNPEILRNFSFDGMTKVFSVGCRVVPKQVYHFQMSIADAGDGTVDSAVLLEGKSFQSQEQYKHVLRRLQIAEQHRQDSLARVKIVQDSIRMATELQVLREKVRQDSVAAVKRHLEDSLRNAQPKTDPIQEDSETFEFKDQNHNEPSHVETTDTGAATKTGSPPTLSNPKTEIQEVVTYDADSYLLSAQMESKIKDFGKLLAANRRLKLGIYLPDGDPQDIVNMRYDLIRLELIKAGAQSPQIFRNGFSHSSGNGNVHRAEIWLREE